MKLWIGVHNHRHGQDYYPFFQESQPTDLVVVARIEEESSWEPLLEEWIEVAGPWEIPR